MNIQLLSAMYFCSASKSMVMMVSPPVTTYAQAISNEGFNVERLQIANTIERKEQIWVLEQCLSSGSCPLVVAWLVRLSCTEARRLQLAGVKGNSLGIIYLPKAFAEQSHSASFALHRHV